MRIDSSLILSLSVVLAVACGDDGSSDSTSDNSSTGTTDTGSPATTNPGTTDPGTTDPGTTDPGTTDPGTDSSSGGDSTAGDTTGGDSTGDSSGSSGGEESSSSGGMVEPINGCTPDMAMDLTGQDEVVLSDIEPWMITHQVCVIVSPGTDVVWNGNLSFHPIVGGETPTTDAASPITALGANSGDSATFTAPEGDGVYPYFCEIHLASMQGVIYVEA